jgi:MFS family permease
VAERTDGVANSPRVFWPFARLGTAVYSLASPAPPVHESTDKPMQGLLRLVSGSYIYTALLGAASGMPTSILIIYLQDRGFSLAVIALATTISQVTRAVFEIPAGLASDRISRRGSLVAAAVSFSLACVFLAFATSLPVLAVAMALWGLMWALETGGIQAFLYDTLKQHGREAAFTRVAAGYLATKWYSMLLATLVDVIVTKVAGLQAVIFVAAVLATVAALSALFLREPSFLRELRQTRSSFAIEVRRAVAHTLESARHMLRSPVLTTFMTLRVALFNAFSYPTSFLFQPYLRTYGWLAHQIPVAVAGLLALQAVAASLSGRLGEAFRGRNDRVALALAGLFIVALSVYAYAPTAGVLIVGAVLLRMGNGLFQPFMQKLINDRSGSKHRASLLSINQLGVTLSAALVAPLFGRLADVQSIRVSGRAFHAVFVLVIVATTLLVGRALRREAAPDDVASAAP